ncbi:hypothetical protein NHP190012_07060 [Helicobacter sp. NHP19-012]|uniref:Uncharacterized protein n=1 Tax=Helicobacter gastrofelis TaxID=2849642 RepID=A0ABM7SE72_9HELI|nr:hypothetical protein [Helicobacter sp. NHP19-012]BCZ19064.1 hypothetical protein NHP190012_07060 [Helicobacter sp. NHP19-012]
MHNTKKTTTIIVVETITTIMQMNTITMGMRNIKPSFSSPGYAGYPKYLCSLLSIRYVLYQLVRITPHALLVL